MVIYKTVLHKEVQGYYIIVGRNAKGRKEYCVCAVQESAIKRAANKARDCWLLSTHSVLSNAEAKLHKLISLWELHMNEKHPPVYIGRDLEDESTDITTINPYRPIWY